MQITGVPFDDFKAIVAKVSAERYENNLKVQRDSRDLYGKRAPRIQARLDCELSGYGTHGEHCAPGAKRSYSGRRGISACWHTYEHVLTELFNRFPNAVVRTAMATYRGQEGFNQVYPTTAYINVGSIMYPQYPTEQCEC